MKKAMMALSLVALAAACGGPRIPDRALAGSPRVGGHTGPAVDGDPNGTARFAAPLLSIYEASAAHRLTERLDAVPRPPASVGYERAIDFLDGELRAAGFGVEPGFELETLATSEGRRAWTPVAAALNVVGYTSEGSVRDRVTISGFRTFDDPARTMLPVGVPSFNVSGTAVFSLDEVREGVIFVTDEPIRRIESDAVARGAVAIVSTFLLPYAIDPTGEDRHYDAIFNGTVRPGATIPSMYVSPRTGENMRLAVKAGGRFEMVGEVQTEIRPLRALVAEITGAERPDEIVYVISHADGYGANDNAAGAGGIVELARSIKRLILAGTIERPSRTIRFLIGSENETARFALEELGGTPIAGIVADMIGTSYARTGAICLLERGWDPGALTPLPPDAHTPWGAGSVAREDIVPNGLAVILRQALVDVGEATIDKGDVPWATREHPWEGGSDHDVFLRAGLPGALVWHFTDFSYSTSLDRIEHVDKDELRRTSVAIGAAACALADARIEDLERHLDTLNLERRVRIGAIEPEEREDGPLAQDWRRWMNGSRLWLRALCSGDPLPEPLSLDEHSDE